MNKTLSWGSALLVCFFVFLFIVGIVSSLNNQTTTSGGSQQNSVADINANVSPAAPVVATSAVQSNVPQFGDGNYIVGTDIQPGTYRTREASAGCYYERLSGFGGTTANIIANGNIDAPAVVTIAASDKGFNSTGCGTWTEDLSAITNSSTTFGDGIFIVGTDIQPGTYRSTGSSGCYYARLSGFGGTTANIIANQNTNFSAIVTIAATDKGFESSGCGTWNVASIPSVLPKMTATQTNVVLTAPSPSIPTPISAPAKDNWSSFSSVDFQDILDDPGHYLGDNVKVVGMVFDFLGAGGRGGTDNYVEIEDPNNPSSATARIMLQIDSDANYYMATQNLNSIADVSLSGNLPDSVTAYGVVRESVSFSLTAGGFVSVPVIEISRIDKCNDLLPTCKLGSASIFPAGLSTPNTTGITNQTSQTASPSPVASAPSNPRYFQLNVAGACESDGNGTVILTGYPYANGYSIPSDDITEWSNGSVGFTVPSDMTAGTYQVDVRGYTPGVGTCPDVKGGSITVP